jgi:hypothetical protein
MKDPDSIGKLRRSRIERRRAMEPLESLEEIGELSPA